MIINFYRQAQVLKSKEFIHFLDSFKNFIKVKEKTIELIFPYKITVKNL